MGVMRTAAAVSAPAPASLAPRALYQEVADRLRQRIDSHALEPGSWIDELKLAQEFGISRTPLREALKVLAVEGLVTMKLRRGAYVTEVSRSARSCSSCTPGWRSGCASATPSSP